MSSHQGKSVKCGAKGTVRVFPYNEETPTGPKRCHEGTVNHGKEALALQNQEGNVIHVQKSQAISTCA